MSREMNRQVDHVDDPSEHRFDGAPRAVALAEFLQGNWLLLVNAIIVVKGSKHVINGVEQDPTHSLSCCAALAESEEVVNKNIYVSERLELRRQQRVANSSHGQGHGALGTSGS